MKCLYPNSECAAYNMDKEGYCKEAKCPTLESYLLCILNKVCEGLEELKLSFSDKHYARIVEQYEGQIAEIVLALGKELIIDD